MQHIDWEQRLTQKFEADNVLIFHPTLIIIFCDFKSSGGIFQLHSIKKKKKTLPKRFMKHVLVGENVRTSKLMDCKSKLSLQGNYKELGQ